MSYLINDSLFYTCREKACNAIIVTVKNKSWLEEKNTIDLAIFFHNNHWLTLQDFQKMDDATELGDLDTDINPFDKDDNSEDEEISFSHSSKREKILDFLRAKLKEDIQGKNF